MAKRKVPSQAASGFETFSDSIVGRQITDGTSQLTNTNFALDRIIPEKDSKKFQTAPFSDYITLENLKIEEDVPTTVVQSDGKKRPVRFNTNKKDASKSLFGSLRERIRVSIARIIKNFPGAILIDKDALSVVTDKTAENITYNPTTNRTTFTVQTGRFFNPFDIALLQPTANETINAENKLRNLFSSYKKYIIIVDDKKYAVSNYTQPDSFNQITLSVTGKPFTGSTYSDSFILRPNDNVVEEFYLGLDDLEQTLLNRETFPIYQAGFTVPKTSLDESKTELVSVLVNWPTSSDGHNIQITGLKFDEYLTRLNDLATEIDNYKSNLVTRFLVAPQLFEFDTEDQKIDKIFQLYGQSFDKVKSYIDNIAYMRNVSYDSIDNIPDVFLKNLANTLGLNTINLFDQKSLEEQIYNASSVTYDGQSIGKNLVDAELEFYRRLLVNLAFIYKSKGTRSSIEFFLKFIGAPEPMVKIDEFVYKVNSALPSSTLDDITNTLNNIQVSNSVTFNSSTYTYTLSSLTGLTTNTQISDYPVNDISLLPKAPTTNQENIFFQMGSGWSNVSLDHRSSDILDTESSVVTGRTKTLLTKSKPYSYGEDYFDVYRTLPGLDYGFTINSEIDNLQGQILEDENLSNLTLNRKNINVFVSAANAINYDIWRKSRELEVTFGTNSLEPQTGFTFSEYLQNTFSNQITNSNLVKYKKNYIALEDVYQDYLNQLTASGYTTYDMISTSDFVNQMSPYWSNVLEQIIPSTTLWMGGNLIENNIFGRPKFSYRKPCKPLEVVENLYPNFETVIEEDLETIIGDPDNLRGLIEFSGVTFTLHIDIDGFDYSGTTQVNLTGSTLFGTGFTASESCTTLTTSSTKIPLICEYKNWINLDLTTIKNSWKSAITSLVNQINQTEVQYSAFNSPSYVPSAAISSGYTQLISHEFYTGSDGIEKVKFIAHTNSSGECLVKNNLDFYFDVDYKYTEPKCHLDLSFDSVCDVYSGFPTCKVATDIIVSLTGATVQSGNDSGWGIYVQRNCTPGNNIATGYNSTYTDTSFLQIVGENCKFKLTNVREDEVIDLIFTDAANCDKKVKIEGLSFRYVEYPTEAPDLPLSVNTGYTLVPKVQYRNSYNYGLKHNTKVIVVSGATINSSTTSANIASYLAAGTLVKKYVKDLTSGDVIMGGSYLSCSTFPSSIFEYAADNDDYSFSYDYSTYTITDIDCLSSIKKSEITGVTVNGEQVVIEVLPTTKLRVYTNKEVDEATYRVTKRDGYFFDSRSPEFLQLKPETPEEPCCYYPSDYYDTGDFLITDKGELLEIVAVNLNYCENNLYYNINISGLQPENLILFNGNDNVQVLIQHAYTKFNRLNANLSQYYIDTQCCTTAIEDPVRNYTTACGSITPAVPCGSAYPVVTPTPTGTPTTTPTSTSTPTTTSTPTSTSTGTPTSTSTPTSTPTSTATPTITPDLTATPTSTSTTTPTTSCEFVIDTVAVITTPTPTTTTTPTSTSTANCDFVIDTVAVIATPTPSITTTPTSTNTPNCEFVIDTVAVIATPTPTSTITTTPTSTETINCDFVIDTVAVINTPTPTSTITSTPTSTSTSTPTSTETPTSTYTPNCEFVIDTVAVIATPTPTSTITSTPTSTSTGTPTSTETPTSTYTPNCEFVIDTVAVITTPTPTSTTTNTPTSTTTNTPTSTETPTSTGTPTSTATPTSTETPTPTGTPTSTSTPTSTYTPNCEFVIDTVAVITTPTPTSTPTSTATPTITPTTTNTPTSTATPTITPTVTPTVTNSAPTDIVLSNNSVNENSSVNTIVGTLSSVDANAGNTHTYTIQAGGNGDLFNISGTSLRTSQSFNYESATSYTVTIRSTDNTGLYFDKTFTINVNNVNESPYGLNFSGSIPENSATDTTVGTVTSLDVDSGDTFTYALVDTANYPDNSSFTITNGGILKSAAVFNYESKSSYSIKVRTTDAGGLTYDGVLTVPITNVNETPTNLALSSSSISENVPTGTTIGTLSSTDPDSGDTFTYALVDGGSYPDNASFTISGTSLRSAAVFNFEAKSSYSIRVRTTDAGGLTYDKTLTITITNVTISVTASATTNVTCNGGSNGEITVSGANGGTANYTYSKDGTNYQSSNVFSSLTAGTYTIYAKDSYGEVGSTSVSVTQPAVVSATITQTNVTCNGGGDGSIVISSVTGGQGGPYSTKLNAGGTYQVITTSRTYSSLSAGTNTIYLKDSSGCENTYSVTITQPAVVTVGTSSITYTTCYNGSDGSVTLTATGGNGSYQYRINSGTWVNSATFSSLGATSYTFQSRDTAGCESGVITVDMTKTAPNCTRTVSNVSCNGGSNGSITASSPTGGNSGVYTVSIDNSTYYAFPKTFSSLTAGSYTVYVKDSAGCIQSYAASITEPTAQIVTLTNETNPPCGNPTGGSLDLVSSGGVWPKTYRLYEDESAPYTSCGGTLRATFTGVTSDAATKSVSSLTSGGYCLEVTDANGCVTNSGITVLVDGASYYKYQAIRCSDGAYFNITSPDALASPFLTGTAAVKINNVCYQIDYFLETVCTIESLHLADGTNSAVWTSCSSCTGGGPGAQV